MMLFIPYSPVHKGLKLLTVSLFSAIKFFLALPYSFAIGLSFWESLISTCVGGLLGFFFFYYLSGIVINFLVRKGIWRKSPKKIRKVKKVFSKKNRFIVKTRLTYGLIGIVILTPIILSLPVGAFLLRKYYKTSKLAIPMMCISIILCSLITLSLIYFL
jgi:uncharacterized membrane protein